MVNPCKDRLINSCRFLDRTSCSHYYEMLEMCQQALTTLKPHLESTHPLIAELHTKTMQAYVGLREWQGAVDSGMKIVQSYK